MSCPHCGSWAVRADRSLAGRLVCARCGQPLTGAPRASGRRRSGLRLRLSSGGRWRLLLVLLLACSAWLAASAPPRPARLMPADRSAPPFAGPRL